MVAVLIGINDNSKFFMPQIEPSRGFMKRINEKESFFLSPEWDLIVNSKK